MASTKTTEHQQFDSTCNYLNINTKPDPWRSRVLAATLGYNRIKQNLKLADGCFYVGWATVAHEHMHALGFFNMQSSADRDDWVTMNFDNIEPGYERNFEKESTRTSFGEDYDYDSVMHYPATAFGIDDKVTIVPKVKGVSIGQRDHISYIDARKMKKMYGCA